jgi:hypothetical protein
MAASPGASPPFAAVAAAARSAGLRRTGASRSSTDLAQLEQQQDLKVRAALQ